MHECDTEAAVGVVTLVPEVANVVTGAKLGWASCNWGGLAWLGGAGLTVGGAVAVGAGVAVAVGFELDQCFGGLGGLRWLG